MSKLPTPLREKLDKFHEDNWDSNEWHNGIDAGAECLWQEVEPVLREIEAWTLGLTEHDPIKSVSDSDEIEQWFNEDDISSSQETILHHLRKLLGDQK